MSSQRDDLAYVEDMLARVRRILAKTQGVTWEQLRVDDDLHDIVERSISVMGEAARKVSKDYRAAHPEVQNSPNGSPVTPVPTGAIRSPT